MDSHTFKKQTSYQKKKKTPELTIAALLKANKKSLRSWNNTTAHRTRTLATYHKYKCF